MFFTVQSNSNTTTTTTTTITNNNNNNINNNNNFCRYLGYECNRSVIQRRQAVRRKLQ